jgi:hypothetical protein
MHKKRSLYGAILGTNTRNQGKNRCYYSVLKCWERLLSVHVFTFKETVENIML